MLTPATRRRRSARHAIFSNTSGEVLLPETILLGQRRQPNTHDSLEVASALFRYEGSSMRRLSDVTTPSRYSARFIFVAAGRHDTAVNLLPQHAGI